MFTRTVEVTTKSGKAKELSNTIKRKSAADFEETSRVRG